MLFTVSNRVHCESNRRRQPLNSTHKRSNSHKHHHPHSANEGYSDEYMMNTVIHNTTNTNNNNKCTISTRKSYKQHQYESNANQKPKVKQKDIYPEITSPIHFKNDKTLIDELKIEKNDPEISTLSVQRECEMLHNDITFLSKTKSIAKQQKIGALTRLIIHTNIHQRQLIKQYYQEKYSLDLDHYIDTNFKGIIKRMLLYSMQNEVQRHLYLLQVGIQKMKDIKSIIPILCVKDSNTIQQLTGLYNKGMFTKSLESQIIKLTQNDELLRSFMINILTTKRKKNPSFVCEDDVIFLTQILNEMNWNKVEISRFIDIFSKRSFEYLREMSVMFESKTGITLINAIHNSLGGKHGIGYSINCILIFLMDKNKFYGDLLTKSMGKSGHKHILFWRIIIDRSYIDLDQILDTFGIYEGGKSDVDTYDFQHFINVNLHKEDVSAANLLSKLCRF